MDEQTAKRTSAIARVLLYTLLCNVVVSGSKIAYGFFTNSVSITADGFHSMFDGISNIVGFAGLYVSAGAPDSEHPYGHRKFETIFTIFIGVMMFLTCFEIFKQVYDSFSSDHKTVVSATSFAIMLVTMGVNIFVTKYEKRMGEKLSSEFLIADSQHTKSDILATTGVIIGLILVKLGIPAADSVVGAIVGCLVAYAGIGILRDAADVLADKSRLDDAAICGIVCEIENVAACHKVRTRGAKGHVFVDLHIQVDPSLSIEQGHMIAHESVERIKKEFADVVDVVVHVEPYRKKWG